MKEIAVQKDYKQSVATGLAKGSRINPAGDGTQKSTFVVVNGVSGRSDWDGKCVWDLGAGTGGWQATKGQRGPRKGKITLRPAGQANVNKRVEATFEIKWDPVFYVEMVSCKTSSRRGGARNTNGKAKRLYWIMNVRLFMMVNDVQYEQIIKTFPTMKQTGKCMPT